MRLMKKILVDPVYTKGQEGRGRRTQGRRWQWQLEVSKEVAGIFDADWSDVKIAHIWMVTHKQKVTMMLLLSLGHLFPVWHVPESVLDFGDLYSF